jgi:hypothetical protein
MTLTSASLVILSIIYSDFVENTCDMTFLFVMFGFSDVFAMYFFVHFGVFSMGFVYC